MHDAAFIEISQGLFANIGNITSEFLAAELGFANLDVELFDVNRRVRVVTNQLFADDDRILEVVTFVGHERDQHVATQCQFTLERGGTIGDHLALFDLVTHAHQRLLVLASSFIQSHELAQVMNFATNLDTVGIDIGHGSLLTGAH